MMDPEGAERDFSLGMAREEEGKLDEAVLEYRMAIAIDPNDADTHYNLGLVYQAYLASTCQTQNGMLYDRRDGLTIPSRDVPEVYIV